MSAPASPNSSFGAAMPFVAVATGIATFGAMDAAMKALSLAMDVYNALFWRTLFAAMVAGLMFAMRRQPLPGRAAFRLHFKRATITTIMAYSFFFGLARVPIAEAIAISFIAPIIALFLAAILLGETVGRHSILASILGLSGVVVIVAGRLGQGRLGEEAQIGIASILLSACLYAWNLILQRQQAQIANPFEIACFQNGIFVAWLALFFPFFGIVPPVDGAGLAADGGLIALIVLGGLLSIVSVLMLSWGYARAEAQALVPIEYSMFIWGALFGWLFFGEPLGWPTLAGAVLIVSGCLIVARRRPHIAAPVEEAVARGNMETRT